MKYKLKFNLFDCIVSVSSILFVVFLIIISYISLPNSSNEDYAIVRYNNEVVKTMPLSVDDDFVMKKIDYPDLYGDELIVSVKNKKVSITKEDSPLHYCSFLGEISNKGSSLICAPNCVRVTIESIEGDNTDTSVDIIL